MKNLSLRRLACLAASIAGGLVSAAGFGQSTAPITFRSLLDEMADTTSVARFPSPDYRQLQASSYNRASVKRGEPGWFADSDGVGSMRIEEGSGRKEWVAMEHAGPGCLTRLWAPFFYHDLNTHNVPLVRIYLDGSKVPTIEEPWIPLLTNMPGGARSLVVPAPFAALTARAGDLYLPIPFAKSCKITFDREPFYNIVNWRAYQPGTVVETFRPQQLTDERETIEGIASTLLSPSVTKVAPLGANAQSRPFAEQRLSGSSMVVKQLFVLVDPAEIAANPGLLRSLVLTMTFDGESTVWCPLGDFFGSPNALNAFETAARSVRSDGVFSCRWAMPFERDVVIRLEHFDGKNVRMDVRVSFDTWSWDDRSMHFHAAWCPDHVQRGDEFIDLNFIDIRGKGVLVGDQLTVLNPTTGWWGEGDEKIYVDGAYERGFPDHFGTGTEDYYGWAGGVNPTWADVFNHPFLANIAVGSHAGSKGNGGTTRGFNICTRQRSLDAIPFSERLVLDMEALPGVDQRQPTDMLGYSTVTYWYARPGATCNRGPDAQAAQKAIMSLDSLAAPAIR